VVVSRRAPPHARPTRTLELPFELRQRSRLRATLDDGQEVGLTLERGQVLRGGDRLLSDCGQCIEVRAGQEQVSVVRAADPHALTRVAYHLGNRHVALQIEPGELRYRRDHVLDDMVHGLGLSPRHLELPFEPEAGAYGAHAAGHSHDHGRGHSHDR